MKTKTVDLTLLQVLLVLGALSSVTCAGQAAGASSSFDRVPAGFHEFEMFGDKSVYLSHYPMFGSIHSYQLLLEVVLKSTDGNNPTELYLAHKQKNPAARYSVSPETSTGEPQYWVLPEVIKEGNSFRANIHWQDKQGHPVYLAHNVTVEIKKIVYARLFQPDDKKPDRLTYLLFGNDSETFLAHYIGSYPDFDQILSVNATSGEAPLRDAGSVIVISFTARENDKSKRLLKTDKAITGQGQGSVKNVKVSVLEQVHYEPSLEIQR